MLPVASLQYGQLVKLPWYHFVLVRRYRVRSGPADDELLRAVIHHESYEDGFDGTHEPGHHGPFWLADVGTDNFLPVPGEDAVATLWSWRAKTEQARKGDAAQGILARAAADQLFDELSVSLRGADKVYVLAGLNRRPEKDGGWLVGSGGFHEFAAVRRRLGDVMLVIATDD
jgi:hypothetical protein